MPPGRHALTVDDGSALIEPPAPPAGWYVDVDETRWRYWSGTSWTEYRHPRDPRHVVGYLPAGDHEPAAVKPARAGTAIGAASAAPQAAPQAAAPQAAPPSAQQPDDLRARIPGQAVIEKLIELQSAGEYAQMRSWHIGAIGERRVAGILSLLGPGWTVLHSIPVGTDGSDIDHLLIGPPGVFTLNTKHHPGKNVWVAGRAIRVTNRPQHYLTNSAHEAARAERLLSEASGLAVEVTGMVVLVGVTLTIHAQPVVDGATVEVLRDSDLLFTLRAHRRNYSADQIARITAAAVRPETWSPHPLAQTDAAALNAEFEAIGARITTMPLSPKPTGRAPAPARTARAPRPTASRPPRRSPVPRRRPKKKGPSLGSLVGALAALVIAWGVSTSLTNNHRTDAPAHEFASASAEEQALQAAASAASSAIDANSPNGVRPPSLSVTPGASLLQTDTGVTLVDLPDGTTASYTVGADGTSYSLTLTGPDYGSTVTIPAEADTAAQ